MEQLIKKKRANLLYMMWGRVVLSLMWAYLYICIDVTVIVPCTVTDYQQTKPYEDHYHYYVAAVTVEYRDDFATVEIGGEDLFNMTEYYAVGTDLACKIYPYRYNVIDAVFLAHYSYDVDKTYEYKHTHYGWYYAVVYVVVAVAFFIINVEIDLKSKDLDNLQSAHPDAFKVGETLYDLNLSIPVSSILLIVFLHTTTSWLLDRSEPCVITKYEDVLHDYSGAGFQDAQNFVRVNIDVQVVTHDLFVGTAHVTVYEGSASNITEIRDYYRKGETLTCKIYPSRFQIIDDVSVLHHDEVKTKNHPIVKPKFDRFLLNVMLSAISGVLLYYTEVAFYKKFQEHLIEKQSRDSPQPLKEIDTSNAAYKEPIVLNN